MGRMNGFLPPRRRAGAFTLIELLVVVSIIAVLAGVLLPVMGKVQRQAATAKCASHMGSWGSAFFLYLGDHDQTMPQQDKTTLTTTGTPASSNWQESIASYLVGGTPSSSSGLRFTMRTRYGCPAKEAVNSSMYASPGYLDPIIYGHAPPKFTGIPNRANFLLLTDSISLWVVQDWSGSAGVQFSRHRSASAYTQANGRANFFFADGHMEVLSLPQALARNIQVLPP